MFTFENKTSAAYLLFDGFNRNATVHTATFTLYREGLTCLCGSSLTIPRTNLRDAVNVLRIEEDRRTADRAERFSVVISHTRSCTAAVSLF